MHRSVTSSVVVSRDVVMTNLTMQGHYDLLSNFPDLSRSHSAALSIDKRVYIEGMTLSWFFDAYRRGE
jgi:hypothetical protein